MPTSSSDQPHYSLLFLDVDGTLVGHDDLPSPRTVAALRAAHAAGCVIVICTGRHRHSVEPIVAHWAMANDGGAGTYGAYCNGAVLVDLATGRTLNKLGLADAIVQKAIGLAHDQGLAPLLYGVHVEEDAGWAVYTDRRRPVSSDWAAMHGHRLHYQDESDGATPLSPVDMGVYGSEQAVRSVAEAWRREIGPAVIVYDAPEPKVGPSCWGAFLNNRAADKAHAAAQVAEMLGIPRERTMAIGDHLNDRKLLRWAGLGVCMGDGHAEAQACAAHITDSLADDGAAQAIERFVMGWTI